MPDKRCSRCGQPLSAARLRRYPRETVCRRQGCRKARKDTAHRARVAKQYRVSLDWYDRMYAEQNGVCFICQEATGKSKRLAVDHNHETGEVRGLLCSRCNRIVGYAHDDTIFFERAIIYLTNPPARRL